MSATIPYACPLCGRQCEPDARRPADIENLTFRSVTCDQPPRDFSDHPFPVRWLETECSGPEEVEDFRDRFVFVRGPLPEGSAVADAFGEVDPIQAWIEEYPGEEGKIRLLLRL